MKEKKLVSRIEKVEMQELIRIEHVYGDGTPDMPVKKEVEFWTKGGVLVGRKGINDLMEFSHR